MLLWPTVTYALYMYMYASLMRAEPINTSIDALNLDRVALGLLRTAACPQLSAYMRYREATANQY